MLLDQLAAAEVSQEGTVLRDAAFADGKANVTWSRDERQAVKKRLAIAFPAASRQELQAAVIAAAGLLSACHEIGEACRNEVISWDAARHELATRFPGFSPEIYSQALSYGMFVSR